MLGGHLVRLELVLLLPGEARGGGCGAACLPVVVTGLVKEYPVAVL